MFLCFELVTLGAGPLWPQGHHMNNLGRGPLGDATYQISKLYSFYLQRRRFSNILLFLSFWLSWQPELLVKFNLLNNFGRALPKKHPCQVSSRLAQWFRKRRCLKKLWTTHDGRRTPDIGQSQKLTMSTLCSGELKRKKKTSLRKSHHHLDLRSNDSTSV